MTIAGSSLSFLMEMAMADEKRQIGKSDIRHRIRISLLDMNNQAQALPYPPRPGLHPGHKAPAAEHKMELQAGGAARSLRPAGDNGHNADAMVLNGDTKSASRCTISVYARHQMEQHDLPAQRRQMVLSEVTKAGNRLPYSVSGGERQWPRNDTKFASVNRASTYARHQMEQTRLAGATALP